MIRLSGKRLSRLSDAGSEIVEGNPHAVIPQARERFQRQLVPIEHDVFGDLKLERLRWQAMPLQGRDGIQVVRTKLRAEQVDADAEIFQSFAPLLRRCAACAQASSRSHDPALTASGPSSQCGQESRKRKAMLRMQPADQCFGTGEGAVG